MNDITNQLNSHVSELTQLKKQLTSKIKNAPPGKLYVGWSHGHPQYYHHTKTAKGSNNQFIRKKDREIATSLANKSYYDKVCKCIDLQIKALNRCISSLRKNNYTQIYENLPLAHQAVTTPIFLSDEEYIKQWYASHTGNANTFPKGNVYETKRGEFVRSKSEKILADMLFDLGIPYIYECELKFDDGTSVYPDFTVLNVRTRTTIRIEHMGKMDDPKYVDKFIYKVHMYESNGYHIGEQLLMTFETASEPLNVTDAKALFKRCLL